MAENNQPQWVVNGENEIKSAVENSNNFSNELHQMQDSLFKDENNFEPNPSTEEPTPSTNQPNETSNPFEVNPEAIATQPEGTNNPNELNQENINATETEQVDIPPPSENNSPDVNQPNEFGDEQVIQVSPEIEEEESQDKSDDEQPDNKIEVINNINTSNPQLNAQPQPSPNVSIKEKIKNWYSSLEKRGGEAEAKAALVRFARNVSIFVVGSFFVSTIAEFVDNLK